MTLVPNTEIQTISTEGWHHIALDDGFHETGFFLDYKEIRVDTNATTTVIIFDAAKNQIAQISYDYEMSDRSFLKDWFVEEGYDEATVLKWFFARDYTTFAARFRFTDEEMEHLGIYIEEELDEDEGEGYVYKFAI